MKRVWGVEHSLRLGQHTACKQAHLNSCLCYCSYMAAFYRYRGSFVLMEGKTRAYYPSPHSSRLATHHTP